MISKISADIFKQPMFKDLFLYVALATNESRSTFKKCKNCQISAKWALAETVNGKQKVFIFMLYYLVSTTIAKSTSMNIGGGV